MNTQKSLIELETKLAQEKQSLDSGSNDNFEVSYEHSLLKKTDGSFMNKEVRKQLMNIFRYKDKYYKQP